MQSDDIAKVRDAIRDDAASVTEIQRATDLNDKRLFAALDALEHAGGVKVIYERNARGKIFCTRYQLASHCQGCELKRNESEPYKLPWRIYKLSELGPCKCPDVIGDVTT